MLGISRADQRSCAVMDCNIFYRKRHCKYAALHTLLPGFAACGNHNGLMQFILDFCNRAPEFADILLTADNNKPRNTFAFAKAAERLMQNRRIPEGMQDLMDAAHSGRVSGADQNGSSIF